MGADRKIFQSYEFVTIIRVINLLNGNSKWGGTEKKQRKEGKRNSENYCLIFVTPNLKSVISNSESVTSNLKSVTPNSKSVTPNVIEGVAF